MSPEQFDREVRDLARNLTGDGGLSRYQQLSRQRNVARWVDRHSGMCKTLLSLDPLDDATVWTAFNTAIASARVASQDGDERTWDQLQTDAIVDHITRPSGESGDGGQFVEVSVLIDTQALLHGGDATVAETADGQPLPVEVIRRLCCDGSLVPIWLASDFEVLAVGRSAGWPPGSSGGRYGRCTGRAVFRVARLGSITAGSITSPSGNTPARPISTTWCRSVNDITIWSTRVAGPLNCIPDDASHCTDPTAPFPSTAAPPTASRRSPTVILASTQGAHHQTTAAEVAEELQLALHQITANAP